MLRIALSPVIIWLMLTQRYTWALSLFVVAGISDMLDGIVARLLKTGTLLGAYLDPLADKILVMSIYFTLGRNGLIPLWLMILVIFRDVLILSGIIISALVHKKSLKIQPIFISKLNTTLQLLLVLFLLIDLSLIPIHLKSIVWYLNRVIAFTTVLSGILYAKSWLRHMNS